MTDNEIIKALECCGKNPPMCSECGYKGRCNRIDCYDYLKRDALDLINRKKAEVERLKAIVDSFTDIGKLYSEIKAEAVKGFAERLKEELEGEYIKATNKLENAQNIVVSTNIKIIDNLAKEMVGENND